MFKHIDIDNVALSAKQQAKLVAISHSKSGTPVTGSLLAVFYIAGLGLLFTLGLGVNEIIGKILIALPMVYCMYGLFGILHEASHGNVFRQPQNETYNQKLGFIISLLTFLNYHTFKGVHKDHHLHTNHPTDDPNFWTIEARGWGAVKRIILALPYTRNQLDGYCKRHNSLVLKDHYKRHWIFIVPFLIAAILVFGVTNVVVLWVMPAVLSASCIVLFFAFIPHTRELAGKTGTHTLPGILDQIYTLICFGNNHHMLHHQYPGVPFYRLSSVAKALERADAGDHSARPVSTTS